MCPNAIYGQLVCNMASFSYYTTLKLWSHLRWLSQRLMLLRDAKTQYHTTWLVRRVNKQLKNHTPLYSCHLSEVIQHQTELELKNCHVLGQADIGQKGYSKLSSIVLIYCKSIFQRPWVRPVHSTQHWILTMTTFTCLAQTSKPLAISSWYHTTATYCLWV